MTKPAPAPAPARTEDERVARLGLLSVMDTASEPIFDALARLAGTICGTPIALISLLDSERQWLKANIGLPNAPAVEKNNTFCTHAIHGTGLMEVGDALEDARFVSNPHVVGDPHIRFYAGVPLVMPQGECVGTLCVLDKEPRSLTCAQQLALTELGAVVTEALLLRERACYPEVSSAESRFSLISDASPIGIFQCDVVGSCLYTNPKWREIYKLSVEQSAGQTWREFIHPEDSERFFSALKSTAAQGASFSMEHRLLRPGGEVIHVHSRAQPVRWGSPAQRGFVGTVEDISQRKQAQALLQATNSFLDRAERISGVGGWEVDLRDQSVRWTVQFRRINDLPPDHQPTIDDHTGLFNAQTQAVLQQAAEQAVGANKPWDLELPMVTASGRSIWTRSVGMVEMEDGQPRRLVGTLQDITATKTTEDELLKAYRLLQSVLDNLPCGVGVFDSDLHLTAHNQQFLTLVDLPDSLVQADGVSMTSIAHFNALRGDYGPGETSELVDEAIQRATDASQRSFQKTRRDGVTLDIRTATMPAGGFVSICMDISAAKAAEAALRLSEERQQRALKASHLALWDMDLATGQVYLSDTWISMMGGSENPLSKGAESSTVVLLRDVLSRVPEDDRLAMFQAIEDIASGAKDRYNVEHRFNKPNGGLIWVHSEGEVTQRDEHGRAIRVTGTNRDVTARRHEQEELSLAAAVTRATLEATTDGILVVNAQRKIELFNQQFLDMWNIAPHIAADSDERLRSLVLRALKKPQEVSQRVDLHYAALEAESFDLLELTDGRFVEMSSKPHRLGLQTNGRVWSFRDVTERQRTESELELARETAEAANRAKSAFLATMSHEIRTPLNGVMGITTLLLEEPLTVPQAQLARLIDNSAQSLLVLVDDFLDLAKIEAGQMTLESIAFDLHELLAQLSALFSQRASAKQLVFRFDLALDVPQWVQGDATRLRQILSNLLGNALKFTPQGDIRLSVSAFNAAPHAVGLQFTVADSGIGIDTAVQSRLFANFVQADSSTTRKYGGTGLGLAIVKQLAMLMGGDIALESAAGRGATFIVTFPQMGLAEAPIPRRALVIEADLHKPVAQSGSVLLVEDNPVNQVVALGLLRSLGYQDVIVVANGQEAIDALTVHAPVLILMDCQMPVMDGYTASRQMRAAGVTIPIVAMTANAMHGDVERCLDAGMSDYLAKPVSKSSLAEALTRWMPTAPPNNAPAVADAAVVFDLPLALERLGGDLQLLRDVVDSFVSRIAVIADELTAALQARDAVTAGRHAHSLIGAAGAVCAHQVLAMAQQLSLWVKQGDWAAAQMCMPDLRIQLDAFSAAAHARF